MTAPTLLTGCYRTGSTYLALLLHNVYRANGGGCGLHTTNWPRERHESVQDALDYAERRWGLACDEVPEDSPYPSERWDRVMKALVGEPWLEKTQLNWREIPTFLRWFPKGKAVVIVRDPRSVLASFKRYTHADPPAYLGAAFNCLDCMKWILEHRPGPSGYLFVPYEELVVETTTYVRQLCYALGLEWPGFRVMNDRSDWPDVPGSKWEDRSSFGGVADLDVEAAIHRWRDHLTDDELHFVETICGDVMGRFGYERATDFDAGEAFLWSMVDGDPQLEGWLERWIRTGEGSVGFPLDPADETTWTENAGVA